MTLSDFLVKLLTTPGAIWWPLFIIQFSICATCLYVGWSSKIISRYRHAVTAEELTTALGKFKDELRSVFVAIPICQLKHEASDIPIAEHEALKAGQEILAVRMTAIERAKGRG